MKAQRGRKRQDPGPPDTHYLPVTLVGLLERDGFGATHVDCELKIPADAWFMVKNASYIILRLNLE